MSQSADHMLLAAARHGDFALIETLILRPDAAGRAARLEYRDRRNGWTALHYAAANGHLSCVSMLLQLGANPTCGTGRRKDDISPLHLASSAGFGEIVTLLVHYGGNVAVTDFNRATARDHAGMMAESVSAVPSMRRRDCELILRVQETNEEWASKPPPPKRIVESNKDDMNPELSRIVSMSVGGSERMDADCALFLSLRGSVLTWGNNGDSQLGSRGDKRGGSMGHFDHLKLVPSLRRQNVRCEQVACGVRHSIVLLSSGYAATTGNGFNGQLGLGQDMMRSAQFAPVMFPPPMCRVTSVAAGLYHSMMVLADGRVMSMGSNKRGQLGIGDRHDRMTPTPLVLPKVIQRRGPGAVSYVVCGEMHSIIVVPRVTRAQEAAFVAREAAEEKTRKKNKKKKKKKKRRKKKRAPDAPFVLESDSDDPTPSSEEEEDDGPKASEYAPSFGQERRHDDGGGGGGGGKHSLEPVAVTGFDALSCGTCESTGHARTKDDLVMRHIADLDVAIMACGANHNCCVHPNGTISTFGKGYAGQLGHGDRSNQMRPKLVGFFIEGKASREARVVAAACGSRHTILLTDKGVLYACGSNSYGQLGFGDRKFSLLPKQLHLCVAGGPAEHLWHRGNNPGGAEGVPHPVLVAAGGCCSFVATHEGSVFHFGSCTRDALKRQTVPDNLWPTPMEMPDDDDDTPAEKRRKLRLRIAAVEGRFKKAGKVVVKVEGGDDVDPNGGEEQEGGAAGVKLPSINN